MNDHPLLVQTLRAVLAACRPVAPGAFDMKEAAEALAAAKKAKATKDLPGLAHLAKLFTPKNAGFGWYYGGPDLVLQTCLRAPLTTGLPQAAEEIVATWPTPVFVPRLRLAAELDKKAWRAERQPHDFTTGVTFTPDGERAVAFNQGAVTLWRLSDGALDATYSFGRALVQHARVLPDGRLVALAIAKPRVMALFTHAGGKHKAAREIGDVMMASISPDGRFAAGVADRTFEPGVSQETALPDSEQYEFRVWDLATGAVVARFMTPTDSGAGYLATHLFHPDGRLFVASRDAVHVLSPGDFREVARWPVARVPYALALSPDGARLLVGCSRHDGGPEVHSNPVLDARTGAALAEAPAFGHFLGDGEIVASDQGTVRLLSLADGAEVARLHLFHRAAVAVAPGGAVVTGAAPGGDAGPVEVFEVRRPR